MTNLHLSYRTIHCLRTKHQRLTALIQDTSSASWNRYELWPIHCGLNPSDYQLRLTKTEKSELFLFCLRVLIREPFHRENLRTRYRKKVVQSHDSDYGHDDHVVSAPYANHTIFPGNFENKLWATLA